MPDLTTIFLITFLCGLMLGLLWCVGQLLGKMGRFQRQMDALVKHFGIDLTEAAVKEAQELMRAGKKIEAIKVYREYTGVGLAEAKAAVERMA